MISGRTECALAVLATFCVLVVFFFPGRSGTLSGGPRSGDGAACDSERRRSVHSSVLI